MSKSGQSAAKADTGGQRAPKSDNERGGDDKKTPQNSAPAKKNQGKKSGA